MNIECVCVYVCVCVMQARSVKKGNWVSIQIGLHSIIFLFVFFFLPTMLEHKYKLLYRQIWKIKPYRWHNNGYLKAGKQQKKKKNRNKNTADDTPETEKQKTKSRKSLPKNNRKMHTHTLLHISCTLSRLFIFFCLFLTKNSHATITKTIIIFYRAKEPIVIPFV